ncbi:MAG: AmmeMemoRadiSam system protein B, partial [Patescibacteria group bacterium]
AVRPEMTRRLVWGLALVVVIATVVLTSTLSGPSAPTSDAPSTPDIPDPTALATDMVPLQTLMEGLYATEQHPDRAPACRPFGVVVPHHLVASEAIVTGLQELVGQGITDILLVSPGHFDACPTLLCTSNVVFRTAYGETSASPKTVQGLLASPLVTDGADVFQREHGVTAVVPFIAYLLPDVTVTPLLISMTSGWKTRRQDLLDTVSGVIGDTTAIVVSSDFSHYLTLSEADDRDAETAATILSGNLDGIAELQQPDQSDCPACLWLASALAAERDASVPGILMHSNSATILNDETIPETTSHFAMRWCRSEK